jgi:hypothetical protein
MIWLNKRKFFNRYLPLILSVILVITGLASYFLIQKSKPTEASWFSSSQGVWNYRQKITISHTKVNTATNTTTPLSNFPVEISVAANALTKSMNNGGHVGLDNGYDIVFTSGDGKTKLAHEIEFYASTTGALIAWVKIPSLVSVSDTTLYMYYGNGSETGNEQNASGVWDSNYKGVWHLPNGTTLTANDSTSNINNGTLTNAAGGSSPIASTGKIGGGMNDSFSQPPWYGYVDIAHQSSLNAYPLTASVWIKTAAGAAPISKFASGAGYDVQVWDDGHIYGGYVVDDSNKLWSGSPNFTTWLDGGIITDSNWHYVVFTVDSNGGKIYVDSTLKDSLPWTGTPGAITTTNDLWFGRWNDRYGVDNMDEARISSTARTPDWIKTEYNNQSSPSTFETFGAEETQPSAQINGGWYNAGWSYRKKITIPHSQVSGTSIMDWESCTGI